MIFVLITLSVLLLIQIFRYKLYKSSLALLYWAVVNSFVTPALYYSILNGDSYLGFTQSDYSLYLVFGLFFLGCLLIFNFVQIHYRNIIHQRIKKVVSFNGVAKYYSVILIVFVCGYILIFRNGLPLFQLFNSSSPLDSLERPDVTGALPHYFTVQTIASAVIPLFYFYFYSRRNWTKVQNLVYILFVVFFMTVGGNKGLLLYFFLFLWIYVWGMKVDWKIISSGAFCLFLYEMIMIGRAGFSSSLLNILGAPLRRFFVTQGAMMINRIALISKGYDFEDHYISADVFTYVFGQPGGSAPTFFAGDFFVRFGYAIGLILSVVIIMFLYLMSIEIDGYQKEKLHIQWYFYFLLYLLGMSTIDSGFIIRMIIMTGSLYVLSIDKCNYKIRYPKFKLVVKRRQ